MLIPGIIASSISGSKVVNNSYESIATVTVGSGGSSSIEFTSIASTWSHLQIRGIARNTGSASAATSMQVNGDTGSNYSWHRLYGDGSSATAYGETSSTTFGQINITTSNQTASTFGAFVIDILDYANTNKYKTSRILHGTDVNGSGSIIFTSGNWRNTNAITSIKIFPTNDSFAQYSSFALFGVKA